MRFTLRDSSGLSHCRRFKGVTLIGELSKEGKCFWIEEQARLV